MRTRPDDTLQRAHATWLRVFAAGFALVLALAAWTWFTPLFRGDLARIGRLSEQAFGGAPSAVSIAPASLVSVPLAEADVLVIGDSFSASLLWQSVLVERGLRVTTVEWRQLPGLCGDFAAWLAAQGFRGRAVLAQSAERELGAILAKSRGCTLAGHRLPDVRRTAPPPPIGPEPFTLNWDEALTTGIATTFNTWRARRATGDLVIGDVRVRPLAGGCRVFSHAACDRVLLLAKDERVPRPDAATLDAMAELQRRSGGTPLTWLVVPDKTSAYFADRRHPDRGFWQALPARGLGPDLLTPTLAAVAATRDFYRPDDTHHSPAGYRALGGWVAQALAQRAAGDQ